MTLQFKKLAQNVQLPTYATRGSACFDFRASIAAGFKVVAPNTRVEIGTGLCVAVPEGQTMLLFSRSGHGARNGLRLANCVGVIDSDYRGEVKVILTNDSDTEYEVMDGERIAQGMCLRLEQQAITEAVSLPPSERGHNGLGSTGR